MELLVIGGGPAGLMAAGTAAKRGLSVTLLERDEKPGRKLAITGKGRCNLTNACFDLNELISNVPGNGRFLYGAFSRFGPSDTMAFFEELGVPLKTERGNRVFPQSDSAYDIVDALVRFITKAGVVREKGRAKKLLFENGEVRGCVTEDGRTLSAENVLIATGGLSYPVTGSTGDGYSLAREAGHTVTELRPSLVPLECFEGWCTEAQGLSLRNASLTVEDAATHTEIYKDFGEMLFTHYGVSGPMILSASAHLREMEKKRFLLHIDLKPALSIEQLDARLLRDLSVNANKNLFNTLALSLPRKMIPIIVKLSGVDGMQKGNQVTREMRAAIEAKMKDLVLTVTDFRPIDEAVVTAGGVAVNEIDPKTMESRLQKGLYFAGEVIDVDAYTGGFNLQIAFSTGILAGKSVLKRKEQK